MKGMTKLNGRIIFQKEENGQVSERDVFFDKGEVDQIVSEIPISLYLDDEEGERFLLLIVKDPASIQLETRDGIKTLRIIPN